MTLVTSPTPLQLAVGAAVAGGLAWLLWPRETPRRGFRSAALFGDSLGVGLGPPLATELSPVPLTVKAHVSATARDWASGKYASELAAGLAARPELVLFSLGTNDTVPPAGQLSLELPENFKKLADLARKSGGTPVFVIVNQSWSLQRVEEAAKLAGARLVQTSGLSRAEDNVHLTSNGYKTWAKVLASELRGSTLGHPIEAFVL